MAVDVPDGAGDDHQVVEQVGVPRVGEAVLVQAGVDDLRQLFQVDEPVELLPVLAASSSSS
jgi:hypothetical protein